MATEIASMEKAQPFETLKLVLAGRQKSWKSLTAATGRKPVLFFDFDLRREALAGKPGVHVVTFREPGEAFKLPEAYENLIDVLTLLEEHECRLKPLGFDVPDDLRVKTIVIDSISTLGRAAMKFALYGTPEIRRTINVGGKRDFNIPMNFDAWAAEMDMVIEIVLRTMGLGVDTTIVLHLADEEAPESTIKDKLYTGRKVVFPVRYRHLLTYFNEVWMMKLIPDPDGGRSWVGCAQTRPDYLFDSATAMLLDHDEVRPNIEALIQKHLNQNENQEENKPTWSG